MHKIFHFKKTLLFFVLCICTASAIFMYFRLKKNPMEALALSPDSLTEYAEKSEIKETITATGTVYLADEHEIYAEGETNIVKKFHVEEGDSVETGQLLVTYDIDDKREELESKIKETEINLKNAELTLQSMTLEKTESEMQELRSNITQAEKSLYEAQVNYENYDITIRQQQTEVNSTKRDLEKAEKTLSDNAALLDIGAVSKEDYDNSMDDRDKLSETYNKAVEELEKLQKDKLSAEYNIRTAENNLESAELKLADAENILGDEETIIKYKQQENSISLTKSNLADYKQDLAELVYSTVSPVDGLVTEICIDEGTYTEENTVMLKIADFNQLIVKASIAEYDAPNLELGQKVEMTSDGLENKLYTGIITKINPSASSASTTMGSETVVPIEISVENPDGILKPGYNLDLEIITVDKPEAITVSASAVQKNQKSEEYFVYKLSDNNTVQQTVVEVGVYGEVRVEIISGLSESDAVITSPAGKIRNGMTLEEIASSMPIQNDSVIEHGGEELKNDKNSRFNQMLPSGGEQGPGAGGGMPSH